MSDIFLKKDALNLLKKKHVVFFGDSNVRSLYKDLLWLMNKNSLIEKEVLKRKLEKSYLEDTLVKCSALHKGRDFEEVRRYERGNVCVEYSFITRCWNSSIERMMSAIKQKEKPAPDVIVMNSCLWDITRWGPNGVTAYRDNMVKLMKLFQSSLPTETLVIWTTAPPVSTSCFGALLVKQVEFLQHTLRFEVMEANMFARQIVVSHGFDVLDIHHHLRMQIHRRATDGIHWLPMPVRHMTNLLLTHIALSWNVPLPGNFHSRILESIQNHETGDKAEIVFPSLPPALVDAEEPDRGTTVELKHPASQPQVKTHRISGLMQRRKKNKKASRVPPSLPHPPVNKENVLPRSHDLYERYNKYGEVLEPWEPVTLYNNYGEPITMKQPFYRMIKRPWHQSLFHRQQRKVAPYHF
ncbi:hypothetical protein B7P43_G05025 [Cryptotermes secundus]|nr:PC-esterase domain-containing protein 1A isoform X2 [Cryptotermes secundus]XP_033610570.1 PC-esterase domain-containing protein 1A isoform X2 [Cryptotermes secundus]PNF18700.1 hypothetical protein B7P43_G05025 [Cryptotermes secundus]